MDKNSINLSTGFLGGHSGVFLKILTLVIFVYVFIMLLNFLRDKFLEKDSISKEPQIIDLLSILNKLCFLSGVGFIVANIIEFILSHATRSGRNKSLSFLGEWDSLAFGIILLFVGMGLDMARKEMLKNKQE